MSVNKSLPNTTPMELPNGLSPPSLHNAVEAFPRLKGCGLKASYCSPFFTMMFVFITVNDTKTSYTLRLGNSLEGRGFQGLKTLR